jgi:starch synthase
MDTILKDRKNDFYGILNGIDETVWNPEVDSVIPHNYSLKTLAGKKKNKMELLKKFNLPFDVAIPVVGIVSRLASQKGIDMFINSMEYLLNLDIQWVILGSGDQQYEEELSEIAKTNPDKFSVYLGFSNEISHLIEAGSDMFLIPSQFEPCGLTQMYSLNYGTVPIVRNTGGLADTVFDWDAQISTGDTNGNGFSFNDYSGYALTDAIERAVDSFQNKKLWKQIQSNGMKTSFAWEESAKKYISVYNKAIAKKK